MVYPIEVNIFETYNPGAIYSLWAFTIFNKWICLWRNGNELDKRNDPRAFTPTIKKIKVPTRIIRIEFFHKHLDYFTELDGIILTGIKYDNSLSSPQHEEFARSQSEKGPIQRKLESVQFKPKLQHNIQDFVKDFLIKDLENFIAEINGSGNIGSTDVPDETENAQYTLKHLPVSNLAVENRKR